MSSTGVAVLALAAISAVAAWRLAWVELWALSAAAVAAIVLALVSCWLVAPVRARRIGAPERATAGDDLPITLRLANTGRRRARPQPALDHLGSRPIEVGLPEVAGGGEASVSYAVPTRRRGHLTLGPVVVDQGDPLGLLRSVAEVAPPSQVIVHPRHHPLVLDPTGTRRDLDSTRADRAAGSLTFRTLREYVPGDDLRRVHWRSSARTGTLVVRQDVDPSEPRTLLVVDVEDGVWGDDAHLDEGVEVAASVVHAALRTLQPLTYLDADGLARDAGTDGADALDDLAGLDREHPVGASGRLRSQSVQDHGVVIAVTGDAERADHLIDHGRLVTSRVLVAVVSPGTGPTRRAVGDAMVVVGPDAATLCEAWNRWRP